MKVAIPGLRGGLVPLVIVVVLVVLPILGVPRAWLLYLFLFFVYLAMANMWNLLAGYSGLISLCQPAFIGLAGYTLVIITWNGLPFYLGIIAGAIIAAAFALLISIPVFRLRGIYFAIGTLVVPEALRIVFFLWRPVGGALHGGGAGYMVKGLAGISMSGFYWMALAIGITSIFLMRVILRSRLGLGLAAIRDNDNTAASSGVDVFRLKLYSFVIGAFVTGIAGAIFYIYQGYIEPVSTFTIRWTMILILSTVIGGIGIEEGPIVGTVIVVILHFLLARYAGLSLLIQGIILVGIMLLAPQGIMGFIRKARASRSPVTVSH
ncbi:MAG: branched-chain amino acid ABC transporter permease [Dehalococcoidia bacterium]|nr:MAG: branched-chain amino acid ABC transporter permease [Dehalococcoidia bacterium]